MIGDCSRHIPDLGTLDAEDQVAVCAVCGTQIVADGPYYLSISASAELKERVMRNGYAEPVALCRHKDDAQRICALLNFAHEAYETAETAPERPAAKAAAAGKKKSPPRSTRHG